MNIDLKAIRDRREAFEQADPDTDGERDTMLLAEQSSDDIPTMLDHIAGLERKNELLIQTIEYQQQRIAELEAAGQKLCQALKRYQYEEAPSPLSPSWVRVCERVDRLRALLADTDEDR